MNEELNNALAQAICDPVCPVQYNPLLMEVKRTIGKQDAEIERLRAAAGNAASILSRHLAHQFSHQENYIELRKAREGLVAVLSQDQQRGDASK